MTMAEAAGKRLHECERTLKEVQQLARIGSWRCSLPDGNLWWSDELYRIFDIDRAGEPLSMATLFSRIHPDDRGTFEAQVASREPHRSDYRIVLPDGTVKHIHEEVSVERDERGTPVCMYGTAQDLTEHAEALEALRKSERLLQAIFDAEPECVKLLDADANLILMNRAGLEMLQAASLDQVKGQCVCPLVTSEFRQPFLDFTKQVFRGESGTILFELIGIRGRHLWLETHAVPLRNEKGETTAMLGVTRDVTESRRTEEALRSSEARFRAIIESATVGILVADAAGRKILYANPEICRLLGYNAGEFLALEMSDLPAHEDVQDSIAGFQAHVDGKLRATERTFRRKDGSNLRMSINSVPMELDGRPCLIGFFSDITEKRLLEAERLKAQKLESIGTLAGGIAHDFNNLLQGVFGFISLAKLSLDHPEKSQVLLEQAEKALRQSVSLTSQLLTFSKGGKPARKLVDLRPTIENAVKFALSGSRVACELSLSDDLWPVEADEGQIGQVVQNIVLNAEQAMPLGGCVTISARNVPASRAAGLPRPAADGVVEISVRDQGMGIPPERLQRVFDPYFTTKEGGSGLGLATSYSIVKNHDGAIDVRSEPGKGATFTVRLPASSATRGPAAAAAEHPASWTGRVLVMDDEEMVRDVAGALLRALGHEATFAADGAEAIEHYAAAKAAGKPFDVVILDLTIRGGMGGAEAVRKLLKVDPAAKVVVSSGYSDDGVVATFREHGFRAFLKKPYNLDELRGALDEART